MKVANKPDDEKAKVLMFKLHVTVVLQYKYNSLVITQIWGKAEEWIITKIMYEYTVYNYPNEWTAARLIFDWRMFLFLIIHEHQNRKKQ